jgi:hypothetical protein
MSAPPPRRVVPEIAVAPEPRVVCPPGRVPARRRPARRSRGRGCERELDASSRGAPLVPDPSNKVRAAACRVVRWPRASCPRRCSTPWSACPACGQTGDGWATAGRVVPCILWSLIVWLPLLAFPRWRERDTDAGARDAGRRPRLARRASPDTLGAGQIPDDLHWLFWDAEPRAIRLPEHRDYVLERVMSRGGWDAMRWLQRAFPREVLADFLRRRGERLAPRELAYWRLVAGVEGRDAPGGGRPSWAG